MSRISWTEQTWNPVVGCSHVSPGCDHCYAERMAKRLVGAGVYPKSVMDWGLPEGASSPYQSLGWSGQVATFPDKLEQPLHWRKPRMVFVCSMGDLFHEDVPFAFQLDVFETMKKATQHTFQLLTKRPNRMLVAVESVYDCWDWPCSQPLPNVWLGVTAENQEQWDKRVPPLLDTPAALRFVSAEPMLGYLDVEESLPTNTYPSIDWVICGGETGPGARPMRPDWARGLRDQCVAAGVPFHFKAWGKWGAPGTPPNQQKAAGRLLDGREWLEMP